MYIIFGVPFRKAAVVIMNTIKGHEGPWLPRGIFLAAVILLAAFCRHSTLPGVVLNSHVMGPGPRSRRLA